MALEILVRKLEALDRQGWRFGLDITRALLAEMGDPQKTLRFVHVAGSNGKGSTCAFLAALLRSSGLKTGLYTSPHLVDIRERFRLDGRAIGDADFTRLAREVLAAGARVKRHMGRGPTTFEALTALAARWFWEQRAEAVVWETGLGGRLDATNAIGTPDAALITPVSLEHREWLGNNIAAIAAEKAGILKAGGLAAAVQTNPEAWRSLRRRAREVGCRLWEAGKDFRYHATRRGLAWGCVGFEGEFDLRGRPPYDLHNAALALAGYHLLRLRGVVSGPPESKALSTAFWPGRFETVSRKPLILLDGAHNSDGVRGLVEGLRRDHPGRKWTVLNGFLRDKDHASCIRLLAPHAKSAVVVMPESPRAERGSVLVNEWEKRGVRARWVGDPRQALHYALSTAESDGLLVCGSLYLVGEVRGLLRGPRDLEKI